MRLHVSTGAPAFRADFFRCGVRPRHMGSVYGAGRYVPPGRHDEDWCWPGHDVAVPGDWPSGVYVAVLSPAATGASRAGCPGTAPADAAQLDARRSRLLFVVRAREPARRARILYKVPVLTYHAYNRSGGGSLYGSAHSAGRPPREAVVTLRRPGGGIGGPVKGFPDAHDLRTPRQTFAHWDAPFIAWLESSGRTVDYCTDLDLHERADLTDGYRLLLSAGHDEYWTARSRRHVTAFRDQGGNIGVFGGNTCWWRVEVADDGSTVRCAKYPPGAPRGVDVDTLRGAPDHWWETEPENAVTGVSYRNGGGHWEGLRAPTGYTVQHCDHELFEGTGLRDGDLLGAAHALVGYECDGAAHRRDRRGRAVATGADGTPDDFTILGLADLPAASGWHFAAREDPDPGRAATFGLYTRGGTVFNAATVDWARLLRLDPAVETISRNVVDLLS
nr:N,N-dimethylformamidase beta subunit family domain-containing protein [Streptomyces spiramenti]